MIDGRTGKAKPVLRPNWTAHNCVAQILLLS